MNSQAITPKVSIIMPSFNQVDFIEKSIQSALNQDYPNIEFIVIDGGSTDGSVEIIRRYADKLAYWVSESDNGQAQAINKGIAQATGEWICWQNSDDLFSPHAIKEMVACAQKNPKVGLVIGDMAMIDAQDKRIRNIRYIRPTYESILAEGMVLTNQSAIWRREIHETIGYLNEQLHYGFDYEWFLRVLRQSSAAHVPKVLGYLRMHPQTKTSLHQPQFAKEYELIWGSQRPNKVIRALYKVRRYSIHVLKGQFSHLLEQTKYFFSKTL
jgi:glycosyltransferase involved in cell wall biosynthesis